MLAAPHRRADAKAALLGTATGLLFGLSAALTKAVGDQFDEGVLTILTDWHLYALIVVGYASMTLNQLALATGALAPAIATSMAFDPIASVVLGMTLLQESLHPSDARRRRRAGARWRGARRAGGARRALRRAAGGAGSVSRPPRRRASAVPRPRATAAPSARSARGRA